MSAATVARGATQPSLVLLLGLLLLVSFPTACCVAGRRCWGTPFALTLIGGALHVLNGDAPLGACALYLPEVHPELLGLLLGCPRSVGLLLLSLLLLLTAGGLLGLLERLVYVLCQPEVLSRLIE